MHRRALTGVAALAAVLLSWTALAEPSGLIEIDRNDEAGQMTASIDAKTVVVYRHGEDWDLPHYWPLNSPSGKNMLVQQTEPYPHHRAFWFADKVRFEGGEAATVYDALYTGQGGRRNPYTPYTPPFKHNIHHTGFGKISSGPGFASIEKNLLWRIDYDKPVLEEKRLFEVRALGAGEYLLDITFTLTASYGQVDFVSDAVHYAWPYLRMNTAFSVDGGGTIVNSEGGVNQEGTHGQEAHWVDYSNTVDGVTEGLAILSHPSNGYPHRWLTRDYGTFGPRRPDARSGKPFTLERDESISQRVGVLVHRGDVTSGKVAERYRDYIAKPH